MKFTIKAKLGLILSIFLASMALLGTIGIYSLMRVDQKSDQITQIWLPGVGISNSLNTAMTEYSRAVFEHLTTGDPREMKEYERELDAIGKKIEQGFADYKGLIEGSEYASEAERKADQDRIAAIEKKWDAYYPVSAETLALSGQNRKAEAMINARITAAPLLQAAKADIEELAAFNREGSERLSREVTETYESARLAFILVIAAAMLIGSALIVWIGKGILYSIGNLLSVMRVVAKGDMRVAAEVGSGDELGELSAAANQMTANVKTLILHIQKTAEQVAASSQQLTASADQSAEATQEIARSIAGISESTSIQAGAVNAAAGEIGGVTEGIEESAAIVYTAADKTKEVVDLAKDGTDTIGSAVNEMRNIEETVGKLAEVVTKLGERSSEIGQIVDTISALAGQTNLLALNAAIEAARAGEMGKGFAVVAEEVRKLAEQSQEAAKEIGQLISQIQSETGLAVSAMDQGTMAVQKGAGVVNDAGAKFTMIYEMVSAVHLQAKNMTKTMETLAGGARKVVNSVREIDAASKDAAAKSQSVSAATQEQSASMQEIAASSRGLAQLAQEMTEQSNHFKI